MTRLQLGRLNGDLNLLAFLFGFQMAVLLRAGFRVDRATAAARDVARHAVELEERVDELLSQVDELQAATPAAAE